MTANEIRSLPANSKLWIATEKDGIFPVTWASQNDGLLYGENGKTYSIYCGLDVHPRNVHRHFLSACDWMSHHMPKGWV